MSLQEEASSCRWGKRDRAVGVGATGSPIGPSRGAMGAGGAGNQEPGQLAPSCHREELRSGWEPEGK